MFLILIHNSEYSRTQSHAKRVRQLDLTNNKQLCKFFAASISVHIASCRHKECTELVGGIKIENQHEYRNYSFLGNITSPTANVSCD